MSDQSHGDPNQGPLFAQPDNTGPFAESRVPPRPEEVLLASIIWRHQGRANPVSIAVLRECTKYTERQIKGIVEQLVVTHRIRIGARRGDPAGYFVVVDAEDLEAAKRPYREQVLSMWRRLRVLDSAAGLRELLGQLRIEE